MKASPSSPLASHAGPPTGQGTDDAFIEHRVAFVLRAGVIVALTVVTVGALLLFARHGKESVDYRAFHPAPHRLSNVFEGVAQLRGPAIIDLGLLLLLLTPVARVALSAVAFGAARDWVFAAITALVLALLLFGLVGPMV